LASGQGLNPFNNTKALSGIVPGTSMNQLVADSMSGPSFANSGPYNAAGDIQSLLSQPQSSFKQQQAPNIGRVVTGGGKPPVGPMYGPPAPMVPVASHTPQANPAGGRNIGEKSVWDAISTSLLPGVGNSMRSAANSIDQPTLPPTDYPAINQAIAMMKGGAAGVLGGMPGGGMFQGGLAGEVDSATSPFGIASLLTGGALKGAKTVGRAAPALANGRSAGSAMDKMFFDSLASQAGRKAAQQGTASMAAQAVNPAEHAIAEGMMAMGRTGKALPSTGNAINQSLQRFYKQVPGQVTESISPSMLARIVADVKAPARTAARAAKKTRKK
jgi:hypothetical protein